MSDIVQRLIAAGHKPTLNDGGDVDRFVTNFGYHNGPGCSVCGESRCEHCDDGSAFEPCPGEEAVAERERAARHAQYESLRAEFDPEAADTIARLRAALEKADDAIHEMIRYYDGGDMRGSYDGKPERNQLRKAGYVTRAALEGEG